MKQILITGKSGFLAQNVVKYFSDRYECIAVSHQDGGKLSEVCKTCDFVFHLAAVQRSTKDKDFWMGNVTYTYDLIKLLETNHNCVPILFSTSIGIDKPSVFAETKLEAERLLREYSKKNGVPVYVYKLNNIFGQWGKPNFNNIIATFCNNLANKEPLIVNNPGTILYFTYIEDLMEDFDRVFDSNGVVCGTDGYLTTSIKYKKTLGEVIMALGNAVNRYSPQDEFEEKLYKTLSFYILEAANAAGDYHTEL